MAGRASTLVATARLVNLFRGSRRGRYGKRLRQASGERRSPDRSARSLEPASTSHLGLHDHLNFNWDEWWRER